MAIVIDIQVGSRDTFAGFERVRQNLRSLNGQFAELKRNTSGSNLPAIASSRRLDSATKSANGYADSLRRIANELRRIASYGGGLGLVLPAASRGGGVRGGGGGRGSRPQAPPTLDPRQALAYHENMMFNGPDNQRAYHARMANRARRQIRSQDPTQQFMQALLRSRWVQQGSQMIGMPLGIDLAKMAKNGNLAAFKNVIGGFPATAGSGGGGAGSTGVNHALKSALPALRAFGPAAAVAATALVWLAASVKALNNQVAIRAVNGGSFGESSAAATWGQTLGLGQNAASQLSAKIAAGGTATNAAAKAGISTVRGVYGDTNDSKALINAIEYVASANNFKEARKRALEFETPELAQAYFLSSGTRKRLSQGMEVKESDARAAAELNAEFIIMQQNFDRVKLAGAPLVALAARLTGQLAGLAGPMEKVASVVADLLLPNFIKIEDIFNRINGKSRESVEKEHARAMQEHTRAMKDHREVIGGGRRAQSALPSKLSGQQLNNAVDKIGLGLV